MVAVSYYLPTFSYPDEAQRVLFLKKLLAGISTTSGVESTGSVDWLPFSGDESRGGFDVEGEAKQSAAQKAQANYRTVSPNYFRTMRIELRRGRAFTERDAANSKPVVIINETMARRFFSDANPIGRRINLEDAPAAPMWREIVGVVGNVKDIGLSEAALPDIYQPALQQGSDLFQVVVRSPLNSKAVEGLVRRATAVVDPDQPIGKVSVLSQLIARSVSKERILAMLLTVFAAIAFLLAMVGVCGVIPNSIAQRTKEIGIPLAIGAVPQGIQRMILWQSSLLAGSGILLGIVAGIALTSLISSLLFEVSSLDIAVFVSAPMLLGLAAVTASYLATGRASGIDPAIALRES